MTGNLRASLLRLAIIAKREKHVAGRPSVSFMPAKVCRGIVDKVVRE